MLDAFLTALQGEKYKDLINQNHNDYSIRH